MASGALTPALAVAPMISASSPWARMAAGSTCVCTIDESVRPSICTILQYCSMWISCRAWSSRGESTPYEANSDSARLVESSPSASAVDG